MRRIQLGQSSPDTTNPAYDSSRETAIPRRSFLKRSGGATAAAFMTWAMMESAQASTNSWRLRCSVDPYTANPAVFTPRNTTIIDSHVPFDTLEGKRETIIDLTFNYRLRIILGGTAFGPVAGMERHDAFRYRPDRVSVEVFAEFWEHNAWNNLGAAPSHPTTKFYWPDGPSPVPVYPADNNNVAFQDTLSLDSNFGNTTHSPAATQFNQVWNTRFIHHDAILASYPPFTYGNVAIYFTFRVITVTNTDKVEVKLIAGSAMMAWLNKSVTMNWSGGTGFAVSVGVSAMPTNTVLPPGMVNDLDFAWSHELKHYI